MKQRIRRALVSVYDKQGIVDFCRELARLEIHILSSDGTARLLEKEGIPVTSIASYTGSPEMLDGRVKTLHPRIHAGILAVRDDELHMQDLSASEIEPIDLVVVNLYPFERTAAADGIGLGEVVEMIDIGGPTLVRAAAKNYAHVGVVVDPADYGSVAAEIGAQGALSDESRLRLAVKAFRHTSAYDTAVHSYLGRLVAGEAAGHEESALPDRLELTLSKIQDLRYGENPHQRAAFYRDPLAAGTSLANARKIQGKELSFNNILDLDAALALALDIDRGACVIVKHGNPCGAARGSEPVQAFRRALKCDPLSAFGGVVAFNRKVDRRAAEAIAETFFEALVAPEWDEEALHTLARKKKLRVLEVGDPARYERGGWDLRRVGGGLLAQDWDRLDEAVRQAKVVTRRAPSEREWKALEFGWVVCKHVKSNAIVYALEDRTVGIGAGQMSRVDSAKLARDKARVSLEGAAMASDAFFPFRDGIDAAAEAGITAVVQPGGSIRDAEVIEAADGHEMSMVFTGRRHFRH